MPLLTELRRDSYPGSHRVALGEGEDHCWSDVVAAVDQARQQIAASRAQCFALFTYSSYQFTVYLLALLAEHKQVLLPSENHQAIMAALLDRDAVLLGDFSHPQAQQWITATASAEPAPQELQLGGSVHVFTSGSTGRPKEIVKPLSYLDSEIAVLEQCFGNTLGDCAVFSTVNHQHLYGLLFTVLWPLCSGRTFWHRPFVDPKLLAAQACRYPACYWAMSPAHLHRLSEDIAWNKVSGRLKAIFSSGGPLQFSAAQQVHQRSGLLPIEILGSSETGGIAQRQQQSEQQPWTALPRVDTRASTDNTLQVKSPFTGDNWLDTQDQVLFLGQQFRLGARADRIVKVEGKRISLAEVEQQLQNHAHIDQAHAIVAARQRDVVAALICLSDSGQQALMAQGQVQFLRALRSSMSSCLPALGAPRLWRILPFLPRNSQGKLTLATVTPWFDQAHLPPVLSAEVGASQAVLELWVDRSCAYFQGHFPRATLLPGVVQLVWAQRLAARFLELEPNFGDMRTVKFKEVITPDSVLRLELQVDTDKQQLHFAYSSSAGTHSQGRLEL